MIEFTKLSDFKIDEPTAITIGKFDGEHKGHKKIFEKMKAVAKDKGLKTAIFSFDISPSNLIEGLEQSRLTTNEERINRIKAEIRSCWMPCQRSWILRCILSIRKRRQPSLI